MLINSIAAFHYAADLDHHAGEGFHLHADEQLFVGLSDLLKDHHLDDGLEPLTAQSGDLASNAEASGGHSESQSHYLPSDTLNPVALDLASDEHDDGNHVHLQLESMPAPLDVITSSAPDILHNRIPAYLSQAFSPPVPPPTV
ncbi:hypothetical protein [uncultured Pseudoteredinibacter sp.]|uniref:hypothetical protein n=1 Tax=uncultured Pseudoteredinibacter sp. TaxID=1641701 RepID=UPI0026255713|nr:hypothetical protein [uncultured Pseudoteredinibacter sp.]